VVGGCEGKWDGTNSLETGIVKTTTSANEKDRLVKKIKGLLQAP
jgi:hypothetical protein